MPTQPKRSHHASCRHGPTENEALLKSGEGLFGKTKLPASRAPCVSTATGTMGFNYGSHFRQGCLSAGHLLNAFVGETPLPKQGSQHRDTHAVSSDWGDFRDPSINLSIEWKDVKEGGTVHDGTHRTIFPLDRTWMMPISQNHDSKKPGNPDTSGPWDEMGGSGSARLRKEPEGLCSKQAKIIQQPFSTAQMEWFLFWEREIKIALV